MKSSILTTVPVLFTAVAVAAPLGADLGHTVCCNLVLPEHEHLN